MSDTSSSSQSNNQEDKDQQQEERAKAEAKAKAEAARKVRAAKIAAQQAAAKKAANRNKHLKFGPAGDVTEAAAHAVHARNRVKNPTALHRALSINKPKQVLNRLVELGIARRTR